MFDQQHRKPAAADPVDQPWPARPTRPGSCRPPARRAAAPAARWPAPGRSPAAAARRRQVLGQRAGFGLPGRQTAASSRRLGAGGGLFARTAGVRSAIRDNPARNWRLHAGEHVFQHASCSETGECSETCGAMPAREMKSGVRRERFQTVQRAGRAAARRRQAAERGIVRRRCAPVRRRSTAYVASAASRSTRESKLASVRRRVGVEQIQSPVPLRRMHRRQRRVSHRLAEPSISFAQADRGAFQPRRDRLAKASVRRRRP